MGVGRGCSIGGCAGWNLDRAVPIGKDATQRAFGCVELSANDGSTHDLDGVTGFSFHRLVVFKPIEQVCRFVEPVKATRAISEADVYAIRTSIKQLDVMECYGHWRSPGNCN